MIDIEQISDHESKALAKSIANGLDGFFAKPETRERFEEWKRRRESERK